MFGLAKQLRVGATGDAIRDAELLLPRLIPLAVHIASLKGKSWPFCEAIDTNGDFHFYPKIDDEHEPNAVFAADLESFLGLGLLAGAFRSVGLVELIEVPGGIDKRCVSVDLLLNRSLAISALLPVRSSSTIGAPIVYATSTSRWTRR